jgi:hypothetical protein
MASILKFNQAQHTNGTNSYSIGSDGLLRPKVPMFQVKALDVDQAYTAGAFAKLIWNGVDVDTANYWDSTNHRYTPSIAGWYMFGGVVRANLSGIMTNVGMSITKNGSDNTNNGTSLKTQFQYNADVITNGEYPMPTGMLYLNGTGDYVEVYWECDENCTIHDTTSRKSFFWGTLIHAT